jgi:transposase
MMIEMPGNRHWTQEEIEFISENWGLKSVPEIAKTINRTPLAVQQKAQELCLGPTKEATEYMTASQVAKIMGVGINTVKRWIKMHGLKARRKVVFMKQKIYIISLPKLLVWLKENQDKWDSRKVELHSLGPEEPWLKEKRKRDINAPHKHKKWSEEEDKIVRSLYQAGYSYEQIAKRLGRSYKSIVHRVGKLDVWGTGKHIKNKAI